MRVLIAEDDTVTAARLRGLLGSWNYEVTAVARGGAALEILESTAPPELALLDWVMPEITGIDICQRLRAKPSAVPAYIILLTSKDASVDIVAGLEAGADDYLSKPFDPAELRARLRSGERIIDLQRRLLGHVQGLEDALANVRRLSGLLPICAYCKAIRDDSDYWHRVEEFVSDHSEAQFSHGICPDCLNTVVKQQLWDVDQESA
jgi:sigma-B regulation protein RsbU (phosphoserine phosphatase)